jgi:hypothetical protein
MVLLEENRFVLQAQFFHDKTELEDVRHVHALLDVSIMASSKVGR